LGMYTRFVIKCCVKEEYRRLIEFIQCGEKSWQEVMANLDIEDVGTSSHNWDRSQQTSAHFEANAAMKMAEKIRQKDPKKEINNYYISWKTALAELLLFLFGIFIVYYIWI